jgi:hypothetical protein
MSIYGKVFQDGFGTRSFSVDVETSDPLEVLSFAPALAAAPGFGEAVGERVARLARVRHAMYARVRTIERPSADALLLYSDRVSGWRLSEVLAVLDREHWTLEISAVIALMRQLIPAVALFSRHQRDAAIGTIGPERLILTPQGRLVIAEYAIAPGLEKLQYPRERLWREFRVAVPATSSPSRVPASADVVGLGVVALSLLLGRPMREDEYLVSLGELVESVRETSGGKSRKLSGAFATWLAKALQFNEQASLQSTQEAQIAFEEMLAKERSYVTTPGQLDRFLAKFESIVGPPSSKAPGIAVGLPTQPASAPPMSALSRDAAASSSAASAYGASAYGSTTYGVGSSATSGGSLSHTPAATSSASVAASPLPPQTSTPEVPASEGTASAVTPQASELPAAATAATTAPSVAPLSSVMPTTPAPPAWWRSPAFVAVAVLAIGEGGAIAWLLKREAPKLAANGELVVQSRPVAARVAVDGEERGITPYSAELTPGAHVLEVRVGKSEPRVIPLVIRPGVQSGIYVELQSVATVGGLEVRSEPAQARVSVGGQFRGMTPLVLKDLPPGEVEVLLQSGARKVKQSVRIEPGITSQLVVPLDR